MVKPILAYGTRSILVCEDHHFFMGSEMLGIGLPVDPLCQEWDLLNEIYLSAFHW
jgi:hypothetical protein